MIYKKKQDNRPEAFKLWQVLVRREDYLDSRESTADNVFALYMAYLGSMQRTSYDPPNLLGMISELYAEPGVRPEHYQVCATPPQKRIFPRVRLN